jgi:hypothetical protein
VTFTKVLIMYQIYHTSIHPSPTVLLYSAPPTTITGIVSTDISLIFCIHAYTVFAWHSPSYILSPPPRLPVVSITAFPHCSPDLFFPPVLLFCTREKKNTDIFV